MENAEDYARLGRPASYFHKGREGDQGIATICDALQGMKSAPLVDVTGLIEIVNRGYCFGTRTLVREVGRAPAAVKVENDAFVWKPMPEHANRREEPENIARVLFDRLCEELVAVCRGRSHVGLLLSGGMDSRVVACVLAILRKRGVLDCSIVALTWGIEGCRDVVYAQQISEMYGWDHLHFPLTPERLTGNITIAGVRGAEYSPVHLHGIPDIAQHRGLDLVLAASFGDSVGRGEFSGTHVSGLKPIARHVYNRFRILNRGAFKSAIAEVYDDAQLYQRAFGSRDARQRHEIDHQLHYMQRMLVPCMEVIGDSTPVYQAFTSPAVYGYMWSLAPECRGDVIYYKLLEQHAPELLRIPWARTGLPYLAKEGTPDLLSKNNDMYGRWIRTVLWDEVRDRVLSDEISRLGVFNMRSLETLLNHSRRGETERATPLQEILIWIASLSVFVGTYGIGKTAEHGTGSIRQLLDGRVLSLIHAVGFQEKVRLQGFVKRWRR